MNSKSNIDLSLFIDVPSKEALNTLLSLNQDNTPEVGSLSSIKELEHLIEMSALNFYVLEEEFFNTTEDKFLYIDRVVIRQGHRRKGAGSTLYAHLQSLADLENIPVCCEVNTIPKNEVSLNFHHKNGFIEVGEHQFDDHSVAYLKR